MKVMNMLGGFFSWLFGDVVKDTVVDIISALGYIINNFLYGLWRCGAFFADLIETLFRKFAGLETVGVGGTGTGGANSEYSGDISTLIISNSTIQNIFSNLMIFATVMLIFFTIIQIIREQYKDKAGGNPYKLVFRMFKAMVLFMFITAACVVGLQLSSVVLRALNEATGNRENSGISGVIFSGMATNANRLIADPGDNYLSGTLNDNDRRALLTTHTGKMWIWHTNDFSLYWGSTNPSNDGKDGNKHSYFIYDYRVGSGGVLFFNIIVDDGEKLTTKHQLSASNATMWVYDKNGKDMAISSMYIAVATDKPFKGAAYGLPEQDEGYYFRFRHGSTDTGIGLLDGEVNLDDVMTAVLEPLGGGKNPLTTLGALNQEYYFIDSDFDYSAARKKTLRQFYIDQVVPYSPSYENSVGSYAVWINTVLRGRGEFPGLEDYYHPEKGCLAVSRSGLASSSWAMTYNSPYIVNTFYYINDMNWLIGFGGIFLACGVYVSFMFGLIQRIAELGILYVFSPVTLAFFPFDDGAMFNNSFVKPFYKKVISSYAPILSLNLFFPIVSAFDNITWFEGGLGVANNVTQCLVTLALFAMLPKMRTTVQSMLGADALEEKKLSQIAKDAWKATAGRPYDSIMSGRDYAIKWNNARAAKGKSALGIKEGKNAVKDMWRKRGENKKRGEQISEKQGYKPVRDKDGKITGWLNKDNTIANKQDVLRDRKKVLDENKRRSAQEKKDLKRANNKDEATFDDLMARARQAEKNGDRAGAMDLYGQAAKVANGNTALKRKLGAEMGHKGSNLDDFVHNKARGLNLSDFMGADAKLSNYKTKLDKFNEKKAEEAVRDTAANKDNHNAILDNINSNPKLLDKYRKELGLADDAKLSAEDIDKLAKDGKLGKDALGKGLLTKENGFRTYTTEDMIASEQRDRDFAGIEKNKDKIGKALQYMYSGSTEYDKEMREKFTNADGSINDDKLKKFLAGNDKTGEKGWLDTNKKMRKEFGLEVEAAGVPSFTASAAKAVKTYAQRSALMDVIFNKDDGWFANTKLVKTLDAFSAHKTLEAVQKIEANKTKRGESDAYAKSVLYKTVSSIQQNEEEVIAREEQQKRALELSKEQGGFSGAMERAKSDAQKAQAEVMMAMFNSMHGGGVAFKQQLLKGIEGIDYSNFNSMADINNLDEAVKKLVLSRLSNKKIYGTIINGTDEAIETEYKENAEMIIQAREGVKTSAVFNKAVEVVTKLQQAEEIIIDKDGKQYKNYEEFNKEFSKRGAMLEEYKLKNARILNADPETVAEIGQLQAQLLGDDSEYRKVLKARAANQKTFELSNGDIVNPSDKHWFGQYQALTYKPIEDLIYSRVSASGVMFRDYAEKAGDRIDGLLGGKMAGEQVKAMQDIVQRTSKETHQLFRSKYFQDCVAESKFQELGEEFMKAYKGEECKLDQSMLAEITRKGELRDFGQMFSNMFGDADGEMRGGGFATAHNIIARTFRVAMVDRVEEALKVTSNEYDAMQRSIQEKLGDFNSSLKSRIATDERLKEALSPFTFDGIASSSVDLQYIETNAKGSAKAIQDMIDKLKAEKKLSEPEEQRYLQIKDFILDGSASANRNAWLREEGDKIVYRIRQLRDLDFIARNAIERKGDKTQ